MADPAPSSTPTPNYGFNLPLVGGDDNAWGGLLNDNWSSIDTILWNVSGVANAALTQSAGDARYLQLTGGTLGPNGLIINGPTQFNNYVAFSGSSRFDCSIQANFTGGATFGTAQVFFNSQVTFSADALMVTPSASDNSNRAATTAWVNGAIAALPAPPAPSTTPPAMDGTAAAGSSALFSRGDHVHPSDTSRLPLTGGTLTGPLTLAANPTANLGAATKQYVDAGVLGGTPGGFVNKLRNGTFDVWQRGTSLSAPASMTTYTADGWRVGSTGAAVSIMQANGRGGAPGGPTVSSLNIAGAAGVTQLIFDQLIESVVAASLAGQTCTFQIWIANNTGATITPLLSVYVPTALDNWAGATPVVSNAALQSCPNGAWTRCAYTFVAPAGAGYGIDVQIVLGATLNANTKSVNFSEADLRATPGVAPGLNASPPPPELRPIATELAFCQRYYQIGNSAGSQVLWSGNSVNGVTYYAGIGFPVIMRGSPTVNLTNGNASGFPEINGSVNGANAKGFYEARAANATTNGAFWQTTWIASAEL